MYGIIPISSNEERVKTVILLFRIYIVLLVCGVITELGTAMVIGNDKYMQDTTTKALVIGAAVFVLLKFVIHILLMVYFIMWMRRAYHNLHKAGSQYLRHTEGWAAGAWFIPIMNLIWPFQIVRDIFNETQNVYRRQGEPYEQQEDNITGAWWALFLTSGVVAYIGSLSIRFKNLEAGYAFTGFGNIGYIFAAFVAISMVKKISAMETEMMGRAQEYYAWVTQQQAEQYQQQQNQPQQNFHPGNPQLPDTSQAPNSNEENNSQDNFYKP